jgi:hypothetical protein
MSKTSKKIVKITESALVDLIDNIVKEAVDKKKVEWIAEQQKKKASLLESKIARLEKTIAEISKKG